MITTIPKRYSPFATKLVLLLKRTTMTVLVSLFGIGLVQGQERELGSEDVPPVAGNDVFCGPRCVDFVLECYSRPESFGELVREIQWPDLESGASLASIQDALERRGVHTAALRLEADAVLAWDHPVIVHLRESGSTPLGHYVVWLPGSTESECRVWSGVPGLQTGDWRELRAGMSGIVLLTSPDQIADGASAVRRSSKLSRLLSSSWAGYALMLFPPVALVISWAMVETGPRRSRPPRC